MLSKFVVRRKKTAGNLMLGLMLVVIITVACPVSFAANEGAPEVEVLQLTADQATINVYPDKLKRDEGFSIIAVAQDANEWINNAPEMNRQASFQLFKGSWAEVSEQLLNTPGTTLAERVKMNNPIPLSGGSLTEPQAGILVITHTEGNVQPFTKELSEIYGNAIVAQSTTPYNINVYSIMRDYYYLVESIDVSNIILVFQLTEKMETGSIFRRDVIEEEGDVAPDLPGIRRENALLEFHRRGILNAAGNRISISLTQDGIITDFVSQAGTENPSVTDDSTSGLSGVPTGILAGLLGLAGAAVVAGLRYTNRNAASIQYTMDLMDKMWGIASASGVGTTGTKSAYQQMVNQYVSAMNGLSQIQRSQNLVKNATQQKQQALNAMRHLMKKGTSLDRFGNMQWKSPSIQQQYMQMCRDFSQKSQALRSAKSTLQSSNQILNIGNKTANMMMSVGRGLTYSFIGASMALDTLSNMTDYNRSDGSLISGDNFVAAAGKSSVVTYSLVKMLPKFPVLGAAELASHMALGDVPARNITSPIGNIKGSMNFAMDLAANPTKALDRMEAGAYGHNIKNLGASIALAADFCSSPGRFNDEMSAIVQDPGFYEGVNNSIFDLFRRPDGTQGTIASGMENALHMGAAMTQSAADLAGRAGTLAGNLYENTSQGVSSTISHVKNWFKK